MGFVLQERTGVHGARHCSMICIGNQTQCLGASYRREDASCRLHSANCDPAKLTVESGAVHIGENKREREREIDIKRQIERGRQ